MCHLAWDVCCGNWCWLVSWLTEKPSTRDKVVIGRKQHAVRRLRVCGTYLLAAFDLCAASGVQWFDAFISRTEKQAHKPGCRECITQKPPVDKWESIVFSFCWALFTIPFVVFPGCSVEICTPFKMSPASKSSLWDDYGWKNGGSERGCMQMHCRFL